MTVAAPTALLPFGTTVERARRGVACIVCRTPVAAAEPFCAHCGARVVIASRGKRPADVAATRSLQFALLVIASNIVVGALTLGVVVLVADAARLMQAALFLEGIKLLVVATLAATSIRLGVRGIRETADGMLRRRAWAVAGVVVSSIFTLLVVCSFLLTLLLALR
ncbi:hypothetical protein [Protaetiibacter intestinalis]|uniref:Uncharacterized protein n=1 Tax=Protaetiibacter intestinalis TaxID=2419774 RepID=A0A387B3G4_9MICO|nr:hypothetical protein [Protaetiibacter intestinalis]AYF96837.1 hypothetical protein D7I47_00270 [Protaetiibacter intestinalis]